jgi:hypothetical protein
MNTEVTFRGDKEVLGQLEGIPDAMSRVMEDVAISLRNLVQGRTPVGEKGVDPHREQLKRSWSEVQAGAEAYSFSFSTGVPYAVIIEEGKYKGVGPRTVATGEGIFSRQAPRGMLRPIMEDKALVQRILSQILESIRGQVTGA